MKSEQIAQSQTDDDVNLVPPAFDDEEDVAGASRRSGAALGAELDRRSAGPDAASGAIELAPASAAFGSVRLGQESSRTVTVHNRSDEEAAIRSVESDHPAFQAELAGAERLGAGGSSAVLVRFAPLITVGPLEGRVTLTMADGETIRFTVLGVGLEASALAPLDAGSEPVLDEPDGGEDEASELPALDLVPSRPFFPTTRLGTRTSTVTTLLNRGDEPIAIDSIEARDNPAFAVDGLHGSNVIPAGSSVSVVLSFAPIAVGPAIGSITVVTQDGTGFTSSVEGTGEAPSLIGLSNAHDREPEDMSEGLGEVEREAPPAPVPEPMPWVEYALAVTAPSDFTTMAGRRTMPQAIRLANPNGHPVLVRATIVGKDEAPPFGVPSEDVRIPGRETGGETGRESIPVTFAPGAAGDFEAELVLSYGDFVERVPLRGAALPAPTNAEGEEVALDPDPLAPAALPEAHAATSEEARAMLLQAADSLSALAPSYQRQVPPMRDVARHFVGECADAAAGFNTSLVQWLTEEANFQLGSLQGDHARAFLEFAVSQLTIPNAAAGVVLDAALMGLAMHETSETNEKSAKGQAQTGFLGELLAEHTGGVTRAAVEGLSREVGEFGVAEGHLSHAASHSMADLKDISELLTSETFTLKAADATYRGARTAVDDFASHLEDLGRATRAIATTRNQLTTDLPTTLSGLKDRYLEYIVTGGKPEQSSPLMARVVGWVSVVGEPPTVPEIQTYPDQISFASLGNDFPSSVTSVNQSDLSPTMGAHARAKRPADLPGWAVTYELTLATRLGSSEMKFHRKPDGSRDQEVTDSAAKDLDESGGIAEVWRRLLARPLG